MSNSDPGAGWQPDLDRAASGRHAPGLRFLSYNIQAGTSQEKYRHYVTRSWRQILPHSQRVENLDTIADLVQNFDIVGLQEVDSGSLRSGFINQTRYLANHSGFPFWCHQATRKMSRLAYAGNGLLSRPEPADIIDHKLPGAMGGRGALLVRYGREENCLTVVLAHLALGRNARASQLDYLAEVLSGLPNVLLMGDFNTTTRSSELSRFIGQLSLQAPTEDMATYPSWQPQRPIDHVLVSEALQVADCSVLPLMHSDHCPVSLTLKLQPEQRAAWLPQPPAAVS